MHIREVGHLVKAVEAKKVTVTNNGKSVERDVVNNTVAINYPVGAKEYTRYLQFSLWDEDAAKLVRMVGKHQKNGLGKAFLVSGVIYQDEKNPTWTDKDGNVRINERIKIEYFDYPPRGYGSRTNSDGNSSGEGNKSSSNNSNNNNSPSRSTNAESSLDDDDSDLPDLDDPLDDSVLNIDLDDDDLPM